MAARAGHWKEALRRRAALRREALPVGLAVLAVLTTALIVCGSRNPAALGDYAEWTYHGVLFRDVLRGHDVPGYMLKHYPVPNSLTTWGLGVLMLVLPWAAASKLWLMVEVAFGVMAAWLLSRAARQTSRWPVLFVLGGGFLGIGFWAGFSNFLLGCGCAMLLAARLLQGRGGRGQVAMLLLLTFFCHMIPFGFGVLLVLLYARQERQWSMLLQTLPGAAMAMWYFVARALNGNADGLAGMVASVPYLSWRFLLFKGNTYLKCWGFVNPASGAQDSVLLAKAGVVGFLLLFMANLAVALLLAWLLVTSGRRAMRERQADRFFWMAAGVFFAAGCLLPGALGGVSDPGGRMMQLAVWSAVLVAAHDDRRRSLTVSVGMCSGVLLVGNLSLLQTVAMRAPQIGEVGGALPAAIRQFGHVYYTDRYFDYEAIEHGRMDQVIYPTALFLKRDARISGGLP